MEPTRNPASRPRSDAALPCRADQEALQREKDALRIQVAGVAAQQAALTEEEIRLQQRRAALEKQERQLATHLEEQRQRLLQLRDEAKEARLALQKERAAYEERVGLVTRELNQERHELADGQRQVQTDRQRTLDLRQRLKRRWHRHWAAERTTIRQKEQELHELRTRLGKETERLAEEKASLGHTRQRFHGDEELGRRQLQSDWDNLRREQQQWTARRTQEQIALQERAQALDRRESALTEAQRQLASQRQQWEETRLDLDKEAEGLENRIQNGRRKLQEQEQEALRLQATVCDLQNRRETLAEAPSQTVAVSARAACTLPLPISQLAFMQADLKRRELEVAAARAHLHHRFQALERLVGELADQRLQLAEQCARLMDARQRWQEERDAATTELAALGERMQERELALQGREQALANSEGSLRQRHAELTQARLHLEGRQACLTQQRTAWEAERAQLLAVLQPRERLVEQQLAGLVRLRQRWQDQRRRQTDWLRGKYAAWEELRQELAALRVECLQRQMELQQERRTAAERALALEQYRQECIGKAANPVAAEKRLEQLRRRWAALAAPVERALAKERQALQTEAEHLEQGHRELEQGIAVLFTQEAELSSRQAEWEARQLRTELEHNKLQQEVKSLQGHREAYEHQMQQLRDEVERLARLLLEEAEPDRTTVVQAA
jgi:chromosome segregation ATPase